MRAKHLVLTPLVFLLTITVACAQYFGRNKPNYEKFDFKIHQSEHFDIYHYNEFEDVGGLWFYQFSYHLPQSWSLQHNVTSRIEGNANILKWTNYYSFGIYPTTRTAILVSGQSGLNYDFASDQFGAMIGAGANVHYYITPRFRLNASCALNYTTDYWWQPITQNTASNNLYYRFNIGLSYAIF